MALVIGQNTYSRIVSLDNPVPDARQMAALLSKHGFEVIVCDGATPGCLNLDRARFLTALGELEQRAAGADLALVFFAGHGVATPEGNMLTPTDADIDCATGAIANGVPVERIMAATEPARHKLIVLDACRDNPLDEECPGLKGKKLSFTRIEAGAMRGLLLVTSTQFGQTSLDGLPGQHSPFAAALFAGLEANPSVYFDQVLNEVARATYEAAQKQEDGFLQIPGRVVGGEAPDDCLAGRGCVGDARMAALAKENERLAVDASGVRNILAEEENTRGKAYTAEERGKRVAELQETLARMGTSTDPLRQEARRLINVGDVAGGQAKLDQALDADEKAIAEAERVAADRRQSAALSARDLAVLARGSDVARAVAYFQRATRLDPSNAETWNDYARAATDAGRTGEAKAAFEQAEARAAATNDPRQRYWAMVGLGNIARAQGSLPDALRHYQAATAFAEPIAKSDPGNAQWQRDLSVSHELIGTALQAQGNLPAALDAYRASFAVRERLAKTDPSNAGWQSDLSVSHISIGDVLQAQVNLPGALERYRASLAIREHLAKADPGNTQWQRDLSVSHNRIGAVLQAQGNLPGALESYRAGLATAERLAKADPGNAEWQRDLTVSQDLIGDVLQAQSHLPGALESYRAGLAIAERLVKSDPGNAGWQRDLSISHERIGDVLVAQRNLPAALDAYRASLAIREHLAKTDPTNAGWQSDLSASLSRIGAAQSAQRNFAEALESYRASLTIAEGLAKADPGNAQWQRELSASHERVGTVLQAQSNLPGALESYRAGLAIRERLAKTDPTNAGWQSDLSDSLSRIGATQSAQGNSAGALDSYKAALAILEGLASADPVNVDWQKLTSVHDEIAGVLYVRGDRTGAIASWREAFAAAERDASRAEAAETKSAGKPGAETAAALGSVAWSALFAREFKSALAASERARALAP
ncbi:MAG: caspase family protein, partial [Hyphomicrobiaceae bacterium]|nr:caspase family protein [Hyphomicrobiaceae bacterium]